MSLIWRDRGINQKYCSCVTLMTLCKALSPCFLNQIVMLYPPHLLDSVCQLMLLSALIVQFSMGGKCTTCSDWDTLCCHAVSIVTQFTLIWCELGGVNNVMACLFGCDEAFISQLKSDFLTRLVIKEHFNHCNTNWILILTAGKSKGWWGLRGWDPGLYAPFLHKLNILT